MLGYSGVSEWIQCSNEGPYKREAGEDVRAEAYEVRERFNGAPSLALNMVEVAKEDMWPQETRQGKKTDFMLEPPEEIQLCQHPDFRTSDLQNRRKINL